MTNDQSALPIDDILLPGTPPEVRERYLSLASRAEDTTFGLLEEDIVMLDTETTGLSFRNNELIEIAAARISGRRVVDRFETFVHPTGPIPPEIQALTGIRDIDVMDAPRAVEAVQALAEFTGGMPVVAHNASFDRSFIEAVSGGGNVSDTWIDSLSLSRIALPRLSTHRLADMARAFGCAPVTHRAMADVDALCGMWRILLLALTDLPAGLMGRLADLHPDVDWPPRPIFSQLAGESYGISFSMRDVRLRLVTDESAHRRTDAMEIQPLSVDVEGYVQRSFEAGGIVSNMYENFEARPEQVAMAREVARAFEDPHHAAVEAGTGVGKSLAYLLPAARLAHASDVTVGVATKTNALTDQLVSHELPALSSVMPGGVTYTSLKGYDHYPCLRHVDISCVRELPLDRAVKDGMSARTVASDILTAIAVTMSYACQSPDGDVDALGIRWRSVPRDLICASHAECIRSRCPYYPNACFVHGARRRAASSDIVVTNHSLLLRDIALEGAILPPIRHWVIDEAHSFEQEARRQWAHELSAEAASSAFSTLGNTSSGTLHSLLTRTKGMDSATLISGLITKSASKVQSASVCMSDLLTRIHALNAVARGGGGYDSVTLWIDDTARESDEWKALEDSAAKAAPALEAAVHALDETTTALIAESAQMASELSDATRQLKDVLEALRAIVLEPSEIYVYSAELYRQSRRSSYERLVAEKLDIGSDLASKWYPETLSVVYTSATIAVGASFEHFDHAVGFDLLDKSAHREVQLKSSFDYDTHMSVVAVRDLPQPGSAGYLDALADLLYDVHVAMQGSVLTLFTNRREMEQVYQALRPRLTASGLELACQERQGSARRLRERFISDEALSLFALKSFWEGFDAAGDTLRCVVVAKLPFASPNDPLVRERDFREQRSWFRYSLPEAVLSVKQAAGRLIRTSTDSGVLVLADSRIASKRYGKTFLGALPTSGHQMLERASVGRYLRLWNASH